MLKKLSVNFGHLFQNNLEMLQHAWPHPIKLNWSKCSFQGCQTKWKIWNLFTPAIVFNKLKIKKVCKRIGQIHFHLQLENEVLQIQGFWHNHKGNYVASSNLSHPQPPKKTTHWRTNFFFKIHNAHLLQSILGQPSQTQRTFPETLGVYFRALWAC